MDVGEGQTRGTETWESSIRTWVERGFPLKSEAQEGDGEGKVEKGFLLGRLRCLSPTPFPHGHGKGAMLLSALCRERGVAIPLGLGPTSSSLSACCCEEPFAVYQSLPVFFFLDCGNALGASS